MNWTVDLDKSFQSSQNNMFQQSHYIPTFIMLSSIIAKLTPIMTLNTVVSWFYENSLTIHCEKELCFVEAAEITS